MRCLREWVNSADEDLLGYSCVIEPDETHGRLDKPITTCDVDEDEKEITIACLHDSNAEPPEIVD